MTLQLNVKGLNGACNQGHAMPASNIQKISGLKVSKPTFYISQTGNFSSIGEYNLVVFLIAVTQVTSGYCSDLVIGPLRVRSKSR